MTDQIPADKVREILDEWERIKEYADWDDLDTLVKDIRDLLPPPPRPTLADMTEEERDACQWMQADTETWGRAVILLPEASSGLAVLLNQWGKVIYEDHARVTPRPDLPRLEWPGGEKAEDVPAPALPEGWRLADHKDHGRVIVTTTPNRNGYVCVLFSVYDRTGHDWLFYTSDELTYLDQEGDQ